jgi:hypothetical protein
MNEWLASQATEERCSCQEAQADQPAAAPEIDAQAIAVRLKAAVLRTFLRGFCPTGQGGGIDNSCGKEGGGGGGDGGDGGGSGGSDGGSAKGSGSATGGLKSPSKKHDTPLPKSKSKLNLDTAKEAMGKMGYKVGKSQTKKVGKGYVTMVEVTDSSGHTANLTTDEVKDLVYDNRK